MEIQKKYRTIFLVSLTGLGQLQSAEQGGMHYTDCDTGNPCDIHQNGPCGCQKRANEFESFAHTSFPKYEFSSEPINLRDPETLKGSFMAYGPNSKNEDQLETWIELKSGLYLLLCVHNGNQKEYTKEGLDFYRGKLKRDEGSLLKSLSEGKSKLFPSEFQCNMLSGPTCICGFFNHHTSGGVHTERCQHSDLDSVPDQQAIPEINAYQLYQASVEKKKRSTIEELKRELKIARAEVKALSDGWDEILQEIDEIQKENRRTSLRIDSPEVKTEPYQGESSGRLSPFVGSQIVDLQKSLTKD